MFGFHHRSVPTFQSDVIGQTPLPSPLSCQNQSFQIIVFDANKLLSRAETKLTRREKANISNKQNAASIIPTASPRRPVRGGGANAAMATTASAKLTVAVAMYWKAVAAVSEGVQEGGKEGRMAGGQWRQAHKETTSRAIELVLVIVVTMSPPDKTGWRWVILSRGGVPR